MTSIVHQLINLRSKLLVMLLSGVLIFAGLVINPPTIQAVEDCEDKYSCEDADDKKQCLEDKEGCLSEALQENRSKQNTLTNTISVLNGEINIQQVQINQLVAEINTLETEINELSKRINGLGLSLDRLSTMLVDRVRAQYKRTQTNPLSLFLKADSFNEFLTQYKYLSKAGEQTAFAMTKAETQRLQYDQQKSLKEQKQQEVLEKRLELEQKRQELAAKRQEQQAILDITRSNEERYQQLLEQARRELAQITSAASVVIREGNEVEVSQGEVIGTMGDSGYARGKHLHFSVYNYTVDQFKEQPQWSWYYSNHINPLSKLKSQTVNWNTDCEIDKNKGLIGLVQSGNGNWQWPMDGIRITQNYGSNTCYNYFYNGNPHPALDIVGSPTNVRSVADGEAYFCRNCLGDGGNGVFIFHEGDYMTVYWHLQ